MLRKCLFAFIAVFAISTAAIADEARDQSGKARSSTRVQLSDAELDDVYAGAFTIQILNNPGNAEQIKVDQNHFKCINLCGGVPPDTGTTGIHIVITPSDKVIVHCIGGTPCF